MIRRYKMKKQFKFLTVVCSTSVLLLVSGNALSQENADFKIDTVNSNKATVSNIKLQKNNESYILKGKVYNTVKSRTPIPGHVDISVIDANGKTVNTTPVSIYRSSKKAQFAKFKQVLKVSPTTGSTIRVTHHNAPLGVNATDLKHK